MNECTILNMLKKNISLKILGASGSSLHIDEVLAELVTLMIPFVNKEVPKETSLYTLYTDLKQHIKCLNWKDATRFSLYEYFKIHFKDIDMDKKKKYAKAISIIKVEDTGYISVTKPELLKTYSTLKVREEGFVYGNEEVKKRSTL